MCYICTIIKTLKSSEMKTAINIANIWNFNNEVMDIAYAGNDYNFEAKGIKHDRGK